MAGPYNQRDDLSDAIPMKKSNPLVMFGIIGAVALIAAVIGFSSWKKKSDDKALKAAAASAVAAQAANTDNMTPEERKQHIEITRKSLESVAVKEAEKKKEDEAKAAEKPAEPAAAPAGGGTPGPVAKAPAGGGEPPPAPAPKKPSASQKKTASDLSALEGEIGKIK